jgi:hypothetical protein
MRLNNDYEVSMLVKIGRAQDVILGSPKDPPLFDESPSQLYRGEEMADDE